MKRIIFFAAILGILSTSCSPTRKFYQATIEQEYQRSLSLHNQGLVEIRVYDGQGKILRTEIREE